MVAFSIRRLASASFLLALLYLQGCKSTPSPQPPPDPTGSGSGVSPKKPDQQPLPAVVTIPHVTVEGVTFKKEAGEMYQLAATIKNGGPGVAGIDGGCNWVCPAPIHQLKAGITASRGEVLAPGQERTVSADATSVCDNNPLPVTLTCSFTVHAYDSQYKDTSRSSTIQWSGQASIAH
jgi:hypothetical protein